MKLQKELDKIQKNKQKELEKEAKKLEKERAKLEKQQESDQKRNIKQLNKLKTAQSTVTEMIISMSHSMSTTLDSFKETLEASNAMVDIQGILEITL